MFYKKRAQTRQGQDQVKTRGGRTSCLHIPERGLGTRSPLCLQGQRPRESWGTEPVSPSEEGRVSASRLPAPGVRWQRPACVFTTRIRCQPCVITYFILRTTQLGYTAAPFWREGKWMQSPSQCAQGHTASRCCSRTKPRSPAGRVSTCPHWRKEAVVPSRCPHEGAGKKTWAFMQFFVLLYSSGGH